MLADKDRYALVTVMVEEWKQIAMPEHKHNCLALTSQPIQPQFIVQQLDSPCSAKRTHERHTQTYDPPQAALVLSRRTRALLSRKTRRR
jgi:hypothetical protein